MALPLYVECVPGLLLEFLETLPQKDTSIQGFHFFCKAALGRGASFAAAKRSWQNCRNTWGFVMAAVW